MSRPNGLFPGPRGFAKGPGEALPMSSQEPIVYEAAAIADAQSGSVRPGALAIRDGQIVAAGQTDLVHRQIGAHVPVIALPDRLILPAMVNAHAHLDLTAMGPRPFTGDFVDWVLMLQQLRPRDRRGAVDAVRKGVAFSITAGVGSIGDVMGWHVPAASWEVLADSPLDGVCFEELLGVGGESLDEQLTRLRALETEPAEHGGVRLGLQPHAPYSTGPAVYEAATDLAIDRDLPLSTHLAELPEELEFVANATGRFRQLLESIGRWQHAYAGTYSAGHHPVDWLCQHLRRARWLLAHCNYVEDEHIDLLAKYEASVAYCPIASDYFGHRGHRYRDMLTAGVNVCLGTDSILCQPPDEPQPLGILTQMRHLYRRDHTSPRQLLAMATTNGYRALGVPHDRAALQAPAPANLFSVRFDVDDPTDPLTQVLQNRYPVEPVSELEKTT